MSVPRSSDPTMTGTDPGDDGWVPAATVIPAGLKRYLDRFDRLNPLQAKAVPEVLGTDRHLMVVAPTSAGKTLVGEVAALRSIVVDDKPAVWLLPARALAAEIAETTARWRRHGIDSIELTGETNMSSARVRQAKLWVATTEKFEALYRRSSLREFLGTVGCLVVDEIHLVGDAERGATLESLIARLRTTEGGTRIVGLSATASNATALAEWFGAQLIQTDWRPTVLTTQLVTWTPGRSKSEYESDQEGKDTALQALLDDVGTSGGAGSLLVFCGSKPVVRRTAALLAGIAYDPYDRSTDDQMLAEKAFDHGIGMHYRDAPQARRALDAFNNRRIHTLVATTGLSTGVNTPARTVVIRDLVLGKDTPIEVGQVQQMLGRAGRTGRESQGFGFVLVPKHLENAWRARLIDGYTVTSQVRSRLPDVLLAEILLGSIADRAGAESWFRSTFAFAQSERPADLDAALDLLARRGLITDARDRLVVTDLGALTTRLMIDVASAGSLVSALRSIRNPLDADHAEEIVLAAVVEQAATFADWPVNPRVYGPWVEDMLARVTRRRPPISDDDDDFGARFALTAALTALRMPARARTGLTQGMSPNEIRRVVEALPRYLSWVAALGYLGESEWAPAVAGDLARRLTWWHLTPHPERGTGRLLWFLERLLDPENHRARMPDLWRRARDAGFDTPDRINRSPRDIDAAPAQFERVVRNRAALDITPPEGLTLRNNASPVEARLSVITRTGKTQVTASEFPAPPTMTLPVPSGAFDATLSADMILYTRDGDIAHQSLVAELPGGSSPSTAADTPMPPYAWLDAFTPTG